MATPLTNQMVVLSRQKRHYLLCQHLWDQAMAQEKMVEDVILLTGLLNPYNARGLSISTGTQ